MNSYDADILILADDISNVWETLCVHSSIAGPNKLDGVQQSKKHSIFLQLSGRYYGKLCDLEDGELLATAAELFLIRPDEREGQVTLG